MSSAPGWNPGTAADADDAIAGVRAFTDIRSLQLRLLAQRSCTRPPSFHDQRPSVTVVGVDHGAKPPSSAVTYVAPALEAAEVRRIVREELDAHRRTQALAPQPGELERLTTLFDRSHR